MKKSVIRIVYEAQSGKYLAISIEPTTTTATGVNIIANTRSTTPRTPK